MADRQGQARLNDVMHLSVRGGAMALLSGLVIGGLTGCSLMNSANVIENIDRAAGVKEGDPGSVDMQIGDIFDSEYERVILICPGASEKDVLAASEGTWQGGSDEDDEWVPPAAGQVELYRDVQRPGYSSFMSSRADLDELDMCGQLGEEVAVLPASEKVTFSRQEQGGPWVLQ
ncbi:hypothetical protein J3S22_04765 [Corynebacterium aurimucosum]|uniref:hypothetical protein n=1 Tax=Corynebacterium aurimucosum TaxID=169292 RepID=UPI00191FBDA1|nr:hypothetical protein [Corynebacterium aurimucosum]QQU94711.1 hypothetical protein I6I66_07830 [Corynebacterium aurimucosum]UTA72380.1 hypothetical protein J3S22_04765 [Corynebacterium aurimucosum]